MSDVDSSNHIDGNTLASLMSKKLLRFLVKCSFVLVVCFVITGVLAKLNFLGEGVLDLFHLDRERNIPTWYAVVQLAIAGTICSLIGLFAKFPLSRKLHRFFWFGLATAFFLLSLDEMVSFHERFDRRVVFGIQLTMRWVIYFLPVVSLAGVLFFTIASIVLRSHKPVFRKLSLGLIVLFGSAMGLEMLKPVILPSNFLSSMPELRYAIIILQIIGEEFLELIGGSLALCATAHYLLQEVIFSNFHDRTSLPLVQNTDASKKT